MAGMPDFAFQKPRLVVFVDGCFWHGCPTHYREPKSNKQYWKEKIARNCESDRVVSRELRTRGWKVLRIWEHDLRNEAQIVRRIRAKLSANNAQ
jgi:DNA mismatch endonuclease (patch repair protein)